MKLLLTIFAVLLAIPSHAQNLNNQGHKSKGVRAGWAACDVVGATVPLAAKAPGDLVTLPLPSRYVKVPLVAILEEPATISLVGKTITATIQIEGSDGAEYSVSSTGGWSIPPSVRIYFTTDSRPYSFGHANVNDTAYWWSDTAFAYLTDTIHGFALPMTITLTAPLDPAQWSDANGHRATESPAYTSAFLAAADHPAQAGFSFGSGNFFDTGIGAWLGSITLHVLAFDSQ